MKNDSRTQHDPARRAFLGSTAKIAAAAALAPVLGCAGTSKKTAAKRSIPQIPPQSWETKPRNPRFWVAHRPERVLFNVIDDDIEIKEFPGGMYGVMRNEGLQNISENWMKLAQWREESKYQEAHHQWLEECFTPQAESLEEYVFDLYVPIAE